MTYYTQHLLCHTIVLNHSPSLSHPQGGCGALSDSSEYAETGQGSGKQPETDVREHLVDP